MAPPVINKAGSFLFSERSHPPAMSLNSGIYDIVNLGSIPRCAGAPPGSVDVGMPMMGVSPPLMVSREFAVPVTLGSQLK